METTEEYWMSPDGDDENRGSREHPFAGLEAALSRVRERVSGASGDTKLSRIVLNVAPGTYPVDAVTLTDAETASGEIPLTIRGVGDGRVRFSGAVTASDLEPVPEDVAARLHEDVRKRVRMIDLSDHDSIGGFASRGMGRPTTASHPELFIDDRPAKISVFPKHEFLRIAGFPDEGAHDDEHGGTIGDNAHGFYYDDDRVEVWRSLDEVMIHGYWCWDWANTYEAVESIDTKRKLIKLVPPGSSWGFREGNRYQFVNVLEEITEPGEYAVDTAARRVYVLPPAHYTTMSVSVCAGPALRFSDASAVAVEGITIEGYRGIGVEVTGGRDIAFNSCTIRNVGNHGVSIEGGIRHVVRKCRVHDTGDAGVCVSGGDRKTLAPADHLVDDNHIHHFGSWSRCYVPGVRVHGVGIRVSKNLIHDAPHSGILYQGNEIVMEYNEIHHVTLESGDAGAIYTGRDFTARGNVIRYNYIHDTGGEGMGSMGVYWDDCVSGQTAYGNLFVRVSRGVMMGGGRELVVRNNIFVDALPAIQIDARGVSPRPVWQRMVNTTMAERLEEVSYTEPPYSERYPELLELVPYMKAGRGVPPEHNVISTNICSGGVWIDAHVSQIRRAVGTDYSQANRMAAVERNLLDYDPGFTSRSHDDFTFTDRTLVDTIGFEQIPYEEIGPTWL